MLRQVERLYGALFLCFLICGFFVPASTIETASRFYRFINFFTYVCVAALLGLVISRWNVLRHGCGQANHWFRLIMPFMVITGIGLLTGFWYTATRSDFLHSVAWEFVPMISIMLAFLGGVVVRSPERLMHLFAIQSLLAGILCVYTLAHYPILEGRGAIDSPHFYSLGVASFSMFALGCLRRYSRWLQVAALLGYCGYAYLVLAYQSRGGSFIVLVLFPTVFIITQFREGIGGIINTRLVAAGLLLLAMMAYALQRSDVAAQISAGYKGTLNRIFAGDSSHDREAGLMESITDEIMQSRGAEAWEFILKSDVYTWLIGRGWGGVWYSQVMMEGNAWSMVHFGPLHLVLKGGLGLTILFHILIFAALGRSWRCVGREPLASPAFCYLICFYVSFLKHGMMGHDYTSYMTWLVLGIALACRKNRQTAPASSSRIRAHAGYRRPPAAAAIGR